MITPGIGQPASRRVKHSTLAVEPGSRLVQTSRPFWLNEAMTGASPEAVAPAKASGSTPLSFLRGVVFSGWFRLVLRVEG